MTRSRIFAATQSSGSAFTCLDECGRTRVGWENAVYRRLAGALKTYILVATLTDRKTWRTQDEQ